LKQGEVAEDVIENAFGAEEEEFEGQPMKPSYINISRSIMNPDDLKVMKKLGYIGDDDMIRLVGEETTPDPKGYKTVMFRSFF
jgi:hypothetical protein